MSYKQLVALMIALGLALAATEAFAQTEPPPQTESPPQTDPSPQTEPQTPAQTEPPPQTGPALQTQPPPPAPAQADESQPPPPMPSAQPEPEPAPHGWKTTTGLVMALPFGLDAIAPGAAVEWMYVASSTVRLGMRVGMLLPIASAFFRVHTFVGVKTEVYLSDTAFIGLGTGVYTFLDFADGDLDRFGLGYMFQPQFGKDVGSIRLSLIYHLTRGLPRGSDADYLLFEIGHTY